MKKSIKYCILIIISLIIMSIATYNIMNRKKENAITIESLDKIKEVIHLEKIEVESDDEYTDYYWYFLDDFYKIDFDELKNINDDTVGWITVNGTNINYPFVQYNNNDYYLTHTFDKRYTKAGWVFLDYRNSLSNLNRNTIIYAHERSDESLFGTLKNTLKEEWLEDKDKHIIDIITENYTSKWQVFSIYHIPTTNDYTQIDFTTDQYSSFLDKIKNRSIYDFGVEVNTNDKILTLSTCHGNKEKLVMHAKLLIKVDI